MSIEDSWENRLENCPCYLACTVSWTQLGAPGKGGHWETAQSHGPLYTCEGRGRLSTPPADLLEKVSIEQYSTYCGMWQRGSDKWGLGRAAAGWTGGDSCSPSDNHVSLNSPGRSLWTTKLDLKKSKSLRRPPWSQKYGWFLCSWAGLAREGREEPGAEHQAQHWEGAVMRGWGAVSRSLLPRVSTSGRGQDASGHRFPKGEKLVISRPEWLHALPTPGIKATG